MMKLTAPDLMRLGVIDDIIPEPEGGAHTAPVQANPPGRPLPAAASGPPLAKENGPALAAPLQKFRKWELAAPQKEIMSGIKIRGTGPLCSAARRYQRRYC